MRRPCSEPYVSDLLCALFDGELAGFTQVELAGAQIGERVEVEELVGARLPQVRQGGLREFPEGSTQSSRHAAWRERMELTPLAGCIGMAADLRLKRGEP